MTDIDLEELKTQVDAINDAVDKIAESGISYNALYLLVQSAARTVDGKKIPIRMIRAVFFGFQNLKNYVFPEEDDD